MGQVQLMGLVSRMLDLGAQKSKQDSSKEVSIT